MLSSKCSDPAIIAPQVMNTTGTNWDTVPMPWIMKTNKINVLRNVIYNGMLIICNPFKPVNVYKLEIQEYRNVCFDVWFFLPRIKQIRTLMTFSYNSNYKEIMQFIH